MDHRRRDQPRPHITRPPQILGHALIQRALDKSTDGASLDFGDQNIIEIPPAAVDELANVGREFAGDEGTIHRIAFAKNKIKDLPSNFATLTRLRYLNLRMNALSQFPPVLSIMPWLEILDLSRNEIRSFPDNPGSLLSLRVLHIGRNRITSLPKYFPDFQDLSLFKVADNPITWPPAQIINGPEDSTRQREVQGWIENIKRWMLEHSNVSGPLTQEPSSPPPEVDLTSDDEKVSVHSHTSSRAHFRNPSIDSVGSHYSTNSGPQSSASSPRLPRLPQALRPLSESSSPDISIDTPQTSLEDEIDAFARHLHGQHGRTASYSVGHLHSPVHALSLKKSLPELRTFQLSSDNQSRSRAPTLNGDDAPSLPNAHPSNGSTTSSNDTIRKVPGRVLPESPRASPLPAMDGERNRYFKRLSTLPSSTISKAVPASLLNTIDACRGILFALSQIYTSLHHYAVYAINDRLASVIWKVLYAAPNFLQTLIGALDRFDNHCLRGTPPPSSCRGVLEACRDCVSVFAKVVGVLQIHLKVLAGADDVRYSRTLLLMLYGSMAEISNSWHSMAPHMEAMAALAKDAHRLNTSSPVTSVGGSGPPSAGSARAGTRDILPITETEEGGIEGPASATTPTPRIGPSVARVVRTSNRRHAGSFSTQDVHIGRTMPMGLTNTAGSVVPLSINTPSPAALNFRSGLRNPTGFPSPGLPSTSSATPPPTHPLGPLSAMAHHSNHSQSSEIHSREGSLGQLYNVHNPPHSAGSDKDRFVNGSTLSLLQDSTELAMDLWEQVEVFFDDPDVAEIVSSTGRDHLHRAQDVTARLREGVMALVDGGDEEAYGPEVYENASAFGKDVANVAAMLKKAKECGVSLDPHLVETLKNLIQCTQEYASLLQFSSFASSSTSRPPQSPASSGVSNHSHSGPSVPANTSLNANPAPAPYYETGTPLGSGNPGVPTWRGRSPVGNGSMAGVGTGVGVPFSMIQAQSQGLQGFKIPASGPPGGRNQHGGSFMGYHTDS